MTAITDHQRQYQPSSQFERVVGFIMKKEGGYVNNPNDAGGETKFGISKRQYPTLDIKNLTIQQAAAIYQRDYYDKIWGDNLPFAWALVLTDFAVNAGVAVAVRRLQQLVGVKVDGIFGQKTFDATNAVTDIEIWIIRYTAARHAYYQSLVDNNPNMRFFLKGWLRRAVEAMECALSKQP